MVLEEASSSSEPASYSETLPTSDLDPYSSSTETLDTRPSTFLRLDQAEPVYINLQTLPRPFSFSSILFPTQQNQAISRGLIQTCQYASNILRRPLRQEEADAIAFHWAKSIRTATMGGPVGVVLAMSLAAAPARMQAFRFPGGWSPMKDGSRFSVDKFLQLRGARARLMWQMGRFGAYSIIGNILGNLFFASYALTVHAVDRMRDPRLKDYSEELKKVDKTRAQRAMQQQRQNEQQGEGAGRGETYDMARQRRSVQQQPQSPQGQVQESWGRRRAERKPVDDMSPTGGAFEEEFMGLDNQNDTGLLSDGKARQQANVFDKTTSAPQSQSSRASNSPNPQQSSQKQGGSSWERLRQNAMSGASPTQQPSSRGNHPRSEDSFSFSQNDEDKQLAKSEAQREFDARIEREREGRNIEDRGGGGGGGRGGRR